MNAIKQIQAVVTHGLFFVTGKIFCVHFIMANSAVYWLVKIASSIMTVVIGVGTALSSGIGSVSV